MSCTSETEQNVVMYKAVLIIKTREQKVRGEFVQPIRLYVNPPRLFLGCQVNLQLINPCENYMKRYK